MVHFHTRSWIPSCQPHSSKLGVIHHLNWLVGLHFKLWIFKYSPPAIWHFSLMIIGFHIREFDFLNCSKNHFNKILSEYMGKKESPMAVYRNERKRGKSKRRSKDARWTPCLPPGLFLQLSVLLPSDASPSRIKYPWKDGLLCSIVLNNRHNQQVRQVHYIYSNTNIKLWVSRTNRIKQHIKGGQK